MPIRNEYIPDFDGDGTERWSAEMPEKEYYGVTVTETFTSDQDTAIYTDEEEKSMLADTLSDLLRLNKALWEQAKKEGITTKIRAEVNDCLKKIDAFNSDGAKYEAY